jgi:CBS domain-containing protein
MKVHEIMTAHARCVAPDNTLVEAAGLMRQLDVGALPVCEDDELAGMVTDRDIVVRGVADGRESNSTTVRDVMSQGVIYAFADQEVEEAVRLMEEKQIRRLPVLNREKRMVGIMSLGDMALSANPAFSGMALKEVSQSAKGRMEGGRTAGSVQRERDAKSRPSAPKRTARRGTRNAGPKRSTRTASTRTQRTGRTGRGTAAKRQSGRTRR